MRGNWRLRLMEKNAAGNGRLTSRKIEARERRAPEKIQTTKKKGEKSFEEDVPSFRVLS